MMIKKILLPVLSCITFICTVFGLMLVNTVSLNTTAETAFLVKSSELKYVQSDGLWKNEETGSGYIGKWDSVLISPSASGAIAIVFTAPDDATLSNVLITAYDTHEITEEKNNDGSRIALFQNNQKIYPSGENVYATISSDPTQPTLENLGEISLAKGDKLYIMVENGGNGNNAYDAVILDFSCTYTDSVTPETTLSLTQSATYKTDSDEDRNALSGLGEYTKAQLISYAYVEISDNTEVAPDDSMSSEIPDDSMEEDVSSDIVDSKPDDDPFFVETSGLQYITAQGLWKRDETASGNIGKWEYHVITPDVTGAMAVVFTAPNDATITNMSVTAYNTSGAETDSDGCRIAIFKNNEKIYPLGEDIYAAVSNDGSSAEALISIESLILTQGDKLYFVIENGGKGNNNYDAVLLDVWCGYYQDTVTEMASFNLTGAGYSNDTETEMNAPSGLGDYTKAQLISNAYFKINDGTEETPDDSTSSEVPDDSTSSEIPDDSTSSEIPDDSTSSEVPDDSTSDEDLNADIVDGEPDDKLFLVKASGLQYIESQEVWKTDEFGSGNVGKWANYVITPGTTETMALVFTAPNDATISNMMVEAFDAHAKENDDGCRIAIFKNNRRIYPLGEEVYAAVSNISSEPTRIKIENISLAKGDKLYFLIENGGKGNAAFDAAVLYVWCSYKDTVTENTLFNLTDAGYGDNSATEMNAPSGLGDYTKAQLISYEAVTVLENMEIQVEENPTEVSLINEKELRWGMIGEYGPYWIYEKGGAPFYESAGGIERLTPGNDAAIAVVFTAPRDGRISNAFGLGTFKAQYTSDLSDGARITIVKNGRIIYPSEGIWTDIPYSNEEAKTIEFNSFDVKAGDKIYYIVDNGGTGRNDFDNVLFSNLGFMWEDAENPDGVYFSVSDNFYSGDLMDEESAIKGFKKSEVLSYVSISSVEPPFPEAEEITKKQITPYDNSLKEDVIFDTRHTKMTIGGDVVFLIDGYVCQPSETHMFALEWTAPETGRVKISNSIIYNVGYNANDSASNGVKIKILFNDTYQIYPSGDMDWAYTTAMDYFALDLPVFAVEKGDTITMVVECNGNEYYDSLVLKLIYDFAKTGEKIPTRYDSYDATQKVFQTPDGTLDGTPWRYYGIAYEKDDTRYFGGNTYEPTVITMNVEGGGCGSTIVGGNALMIALGGITPVLIKRRRKTK